MIWKESVWKCNDYHCMLYLNDIKFKLLIILITFSYEVIFDIFMVIFYFCIVSVII